MGNFARNQVLLALTVSFSAVSLPTDAAGPVNTVNDGAVVQSGTYFNNPGLSTTFTNRSGGGIVLPKGGNIRGVEVDSNGSPTLNGGSFHFYAPGAVVRLDGNIDVRALRDGSGAYLGNGGRVYVDSAYLFQSGNIYANGINGGLVQFNVGSMTMNPNARIEAKGFGGKGGTIAINGSGAVDIASLAVLDSSGQVAGTINGNLINIEGGLVNVAGNLQANGVESRGGTIRILASGQTDLSQTQQALAKAETANIFTSGETTAINNRFGDLKTTQEGTIALTEQSTISANGGSGLLAVKGSNDISDGSIRAGDGGTVILSAAHNIDNKGWVTANGGNLPNGNGGNGGLVYLSAGSSINNTGRLVSDGASALNGGDAGLITFGYKDGLHSDGVIRAIGGNGQNVSGNGGLVVFGSGVNPTGDGVVVTYGGFTGQRGALGTVVASDPLTVSNPLIGIWQRTRPNEVLTHAENLIFLNSALPNSTITDGSLSNWLANSRVRSIFDPAGEGRGVNDLLAKLGITRGNSPDFMNRPYFDFNLAVNSSDLSNLSLSNHFSLQDGGGTSHNASLDSFYTATLNTNGALSIADRIELGNRNTAGAPYSLAGRFSSIGDSFSQLNDGSLLTLAGNPDGGTIHIAVNDSIVKSSSVVSFGNGASLIFKAGDNIINNLGGSLGAQGGNIGGMMQLFAAQDIQNLGSINLGAPIRAGIVTAKADGQIVSSADPVQPNNRINALGDYGGFVKLEASTVNHPAPINVSGSVQDGQVVIQETL